MSFLRRLFGRSEEEHEHHHSDEPVPGWDAINAALEPIYGDIEPLHWGTVVRWRMGGPDPLDGTSAYRADGPPLHWHFVSYGLSELYRKESDDLEASGWGIELTFRLRREPAEDMPPTWALQLLQYLARYVFESTNVLRPSAHLDLGGPLEGPTKITALAFVQDPQLGQIETPHGSLEFVQVVGITDDEYRAIQDWDTNGFLDLVRPHNPLYVTDLNRPSYLADDAILETVRQRTADEGSSMSQINVDRLEWALDGPRLTITLGARHVARLHRILQNRLLKGRGFWVVEASSTVVMQPGDSPEWHDAGDGAVHVTLPSSIAEEIVVVVRPIAGTYDIGDDLRFVIERTIVTDESGKQVQVVG